MFDYFLSLGYACLTAASMSKYGLRAFSGPFDWLITEDFGWVLRLLETDFVDFLRPENLEPYGTYEMRFRDRQSGFVFHHERYDYRSEFDQLKQKYDYRIERFLLASRKRTCFLRAVCSQGELEYIRDHAAYIQQVVTKSNPDNQILFLAEKDLTPPENLPFPVYIIPDIYYGNQPERHIRAWFDGATEFLNFCGQNYAGDIIMRNLIAYQTWENELERREENRHLIMGALLSRELSKDMLPSQVIIYGAGRLGRTLYEKIQDLTSVVCFLDRSRGGEDVQGIPVYCVKAISDMETIPVLVSTAYDFDMIKTKIHEIRRDIPVISLDELMGLK